MTSRTTDVDATLVRRLSPTGPNRYDYSRTDFARRLEISVPSHPLSAWTSPRTPHEELLRRCSKTLFEPRIRGISTGTAADTPPTDRQVQFLREIAHGESWAKAPLSRRTASAWVGHFLAERTAQQLRDSRLTRGDRVLKTHSWVDQDAGELHEWSEEYTVSSIGADGLVYFRRGNGKCAWPHSLTRTTPPVPLAPD